MSFPAIVSFFAPARRVLSILVLIPGALAVRADDVAILARAHNGYVRTRLADHSFKPESYTFAEGGHYGNQMVDKSIDGLSFTSIARTIAGPLRQRGYLPSYDPKHTDLVIMVFWGTTQGKLDLQGESPFELSVKDLRDMNDSINAGILGWTEELKRANRLPWFTLYQDAVTELEWDRYFVVLEAFDFHTLVTAKRWKLMWEARFSIPSRGNAFDEQLAGMVNAASRYFGEDTNHLIRRAVPEGKVTVGEPKVIEMEKK